MKKKSVVFKQLIALFLTVLLVAGLVPFPAGAASSAHFKDVPSSHWAYQYVERAYRDGAIVGTGGDPEAGTGKFSPNAVMTYGQFLTMLTRAFYPEELARVGEGGSWYSPALRVSANRVLNFNTLEQLENLASVPINRYNMSWILVRILQDKGVVLPTDEERAAVAAQIGDWDSLLEDEYWRYYVSSIYASGIINGVDRTGAFDGLGNVTRASAATIYVRIADKVKSSGNDPKSFTLAFEGDWSAVPKAYRAALEEEFYTVYPRLYARFGTASTTRHVSLALVPREEIDGYDGVTYHGTDGKYDTTATIKIANAYFDDWRHTAAIFAHELTHVATGARTRNIAPESSRWFVECLADYGLFRYAAWADERYMWIQESYYQPEDEALRTWDYEAYTDTHWFFAYMDAKYPTTKAGYGLLDSILLAILNGQVTTDGGKAQDDPNLNAVVKEITGYDNLTALRSQYIKELDAGTWTFDGFADYPDNYITENLPEAPDPGYPVLADINLCTSGSIQDLSGEASAALAGANLIDGDLSTKWEAVGSDTDPTKVLPGVQHAIVILLDKPVTFDTYKLYHEGSQGDSDENTRAWRMTCFDAVTRQWVRVDEVDGNTEDVTTRHIKPVTTRQIWLEVLDSSGTEEETVRLYELEVYRKGT